MSSKNRRKRRRGSRCKSRRASIPRNECIPGPMRRIRRTKEKKRSKCIIQDDSIIKPPQFIQVTDSIRDLEWEQNEHGIYYMYPKIGKLVWSLIYFHQKPIFWIVLCIFFVIQSL